MGPSGPGMWQGTGLGKAPPPGTTCPGDRVPSMVTSQDLMIGASGSNMACNMALGGSRIYIFQNIYRIYIYMAPPTRMERHPHESTIINPHESPALICVDSCGGIRVTRILHAFCAFRLLRLACASRKSAARARKPSALATITAPANPSDAANVPSPDDTSGGSQVLPGYQANSTRALLVAGYRANTNTCVD